MGNFIPISQVRDDVAAAYRKEVEWQAAEKLLPYKRMCSQRKVGLSNKIAFHFSVVLNRCFNIQVQVEIAQIESDDVVAAITGDIQNHRISKLVIGASSRSIFSRFCAKLIDDSVL